jgi:hypothetical protein
LNSRVQRVLISPFFFPSDTSVVLAKQCALFPCLSLGGYSNPSRSVLPLGVYVHALDWSMELG